MHTTNLPNNWIAIHDGSPSLDSLIIFQLLDAQGNVMKDYEIPYGIFFDFVADQVRNEKISRLEQAEANDILGITG